MKASYHVVCGGIASLVLIPVLGTDSAVFFVSSVLIDSDHYLDYVCRNEFKDFSPKRMFTFHDLLEEKVKDKNFLGLSIFHTVECFLSLYIIAELTGLAVFMVILWGFLFHLALDLIYLYRRGVLFSRAFSIVEYVIRWNRLKQRGVRPELPYRSVLTAMSVYSEPLGDDKEERSGEENQHIAEE